MAKVLFEAFGQERLSRTFSAKVLPNEPTSLLKNQLRRFHFPWLFRPSVPHVSVPHCLKRPALPQYATECLTAHNFAGLILSGPEYTGQHVVVGTTTSTSHDISRRHDAQHKETHSTQCHDTSSSLHSQTCSLPSHRPLSFLQGETWST